jgi:CHAT domain-containing protein/Tfp pilus assembly protein PilF
MIVVAVKIVLLGLAAWPTRCPAQTPPGNPPPSKVAPAAQAAGHKPLTPEQEKCLREAVELSRRVHDLNAAGQSREALPLAEKALKIRQEILGMEHADTAISNNILGSVYIGLGEYAKAEPLYRRALEVQRKVLRENHPDYLVSLNGLACLYLFEGDYRRAEPLYRQALEIEKKVLGENHPCYVASLHGLACLYLCERDYRRAEPLYRQVLETAGENSPFYSTSLHQLASLYQCQGDYVRAELRYRQALEIRKKALGENHPDYAITLGGLAVLYDAQGDYVRAETLLRQALAIQKKAPGENHPAYAKSLKDLANVLESQGDYQRAEPLLRQALAIQKRALGENHPDYAKCLRELAILYEAEGDYVRAETLFRQALEIWKKALGENNHDHATSLHDLALLYKAQGDYRQAETLFRQVLEIDKKVLGENHPDHAGTQYCLANLYIHQGDYQRAELLLRSASEIWKKALGENYRSHANLLNSLGNLYEAQGDYVRAEPVYRQALEIQKKVLGENHPDYAHSLYSLAFLNQAQGDYRQAEPLYRQALEIQKKVLGENHPDYADTLRVLAILYQAQGDYRRAEPLCRQAVATIRRHLEATAVIQSERQQLAMLQQNRRYLDDYLNLSAESGQFSEPAYRELLAWKGMVVRRNRLARAAAQSLELAATFTRLQRVATQLARLAWAAPDPRQESNWRQRVAKLSAEKEELEAELSARSSEYRQAKQAIPLEDLRAALSSDSVLVDFVEYHHYTPADKNSKTKTTLERRLLGFVVAPDRPVEIVLLGPMQPINEAIETWRVTFGMSAQGAAAARLLRERLWAPIEGKLQGAKIVLISPDGSLSRLPFGALPGKTPGSYLIEERTFAVVPVPQLIPQLVQEAGRKQLRKKLLLLGNVDYDKPPANGRIGIQPVPKDSEELRPPVRSLPPGVLHFGPLPGTDGEIAAIEELCRHEVGSMGVTTLRKSQAGKDAFLAEARRHGYLHLATHGFFIEEKVHVAALDTREVRGNVGLERATYMGSREMGQFGEMLNGPEAGGTYPALLSGLALAGANCAGEHQPSPPAPLPEGEGSKLSSPPAYLPDGKGSEGILTAEEIGTQNLDGVQIVVLSACESGLGKQASGEGLLGLQRSFQSAGARSVVASLWSVDDAATKALMVAFYTNLWEKKMPKLAALRQAQLTMLREYDAKAGKLRGPGGERPVDPNKLATAKESGGARSLSPFYWASFVLSGDWK